MKGLWQRKGFFYVSKLRIYKPEMQLVGTVTRKLDVVSYHLIKLIHGEEKLKKMALRFPENF